MNASPIRSQLRCLLVPTLLAVSALACAGPGGTPAPPVQQPPGEAPSGDTAQVPPPTAPAAAPSGRDFASINICQLLPTEEVAALAGVTVDREPNQSSDPTSSHCWYNLEAADGGYEYYIVYLETIELGEAALALGDLGDPIPGLGDEAYLKYEEGEQQFRLLVLVHGEYAIDMAGSRSEIMQEIARLLIERL